jgi:tetratricopeptide (TPR) repeat protein
MSFGPDDATNAHHHPGDISALSSSAHSPFLQGLLRFSPKNTTTTTGGEWSPNPQSTRQRQGFFEESQPMSATMKDANANISTSIRQASDNTGKMLMDTAVWASSNTIDGLPVDQLRHLASQSLFEQPSQAVFYASLAYAKTLTPDDAVLLARAHWRNGSPAACLRVLEESHATQTEQPWEAILLCCAALATTMDWTMVEEIIVDACRPPSSEGPTDLIDFSSLAQTMPIEDDDWNRWLILRGSIVVADSNTAVHPLARLLWWRGEARSQLGDGSRAAVFWKLALRLDAACQAAWNRLQDFHLLTSSECHDLVLSLHFGEKAWLRDLYMASIALTPQDTEKPDTEGSGPSCDATDTYKFIPQNNAANSSFTMHGAGNLDASSIQLASPIFTFPTSTNATTSKPTADDSWKPGTGISKIQQDVDHAFRKLWSDYKLNHSPQVLAMAARRAYRQYDWSGALKHCQALAVLDPSMADAAYCYVATLVILGHKRVLFRLAHEWVDANPKAACAWFAVGAYYFCCERYHVAQRHFCRATRLDSSCAEAWIAFGCAFSACDESDQALASYRAAHRLSPGEHTSLLYMGMEYARTNHKVLAEYFLQSAWASSGGDPLCSHELGVLYAQKGQHEKAVFWFHRTLRVVVATTSGGNEEDIKRSRSMQECLDLCQDPYWEATLYSLGHSYRKMRQYEVAASCFDRCTALCPMKFSTYSALGLTKHLNGDVDGAIDLYHKALCYRPDDSFSTEMLKRALEEAMAEPLCFDSGSAVLREKWRPGPCVAMSVNKEKLSMLSPPGWASESMLSEDMDVEMSSIS